MKKESIAVVVFAAVVTGLWAWLEFYSAPQHDSRPSPPPIPQGWNALSRGIDGWRTMDWQDISATATAMGEQPIHRERFLRESREGDLPHPVNYLRGLLLLAQNQPSAAWESFVRIPFEEIPPPFLYAPWRLALDIQPDAPNEFTAPIVAAVDRNELGGLVAARVQAFTDKHSESIASYLSTDPADWTTFDLRCFQLLLEDETIKEDAQLMLTAAWRGGRLPENLRTAFAELIIQPEAISPAEIAPRINALFSKNPVLLADAIGALESLQEDRRLFLDENYRGILDRHESADLPVIDETLMLLVISASAEEDGPAWVRWTQELRERFPEPEVAEWLQTLAPPNL